MFKTVLIALLILPVTASFVPAEDTYQAKRREMVEQQIKGRGIRDGRVLAAMEKVPRHLLLERSLWPMAYGDHPLPIGEGQTISQPYVVALMTEELKLSPSDRVLEIGTGSGYQAAILAEMVKEVYSVEIRESLAAQAAENLKKLGYANVRVKYSDGYFGWGEQAPFDAIIITAAVNHIPPPLLKQLKEGGRLILPLGSTVFQQTLTLVTKKKGGELQVEQKGQVAFVPMTGEARKR